MNYAKVGGSGVCGGTGGDKITHSIPFQSVCNYSNWRSEKQKNKKSMT